MILGPFRLRHVTLKHNLWNDNSIYFYSWDENGEEEALKFWCFGFENQFRSSQFQNYTNTISYEKDQFMVNYL